MASSTLASAGNELEISETEITRVKTFVLIQFFFLLVSPLAGGFHYAMWSMLDTALLLACIGITGLAVVLETQAARKLVMKTAITLYVAGIADMSLNVLVSGWVGWKAFQLD